jgi:hypothetical protein
MNRIITTDINDPLIQQPFTGLSLDFIQNNTAKLVEMAIVSQIGSDYSTLVPYAIHKCKIGAMGNTIGGDGYILFGGEVYYVNGITGILAFTNVLVANITIANDGVADPVTFTDAVSRNVHNHREITWSDAISGTGAFDYTDVVILNTTHTATINQCEVTAGSVYTNSAATTGFIKYPTDATINYFNWLSPTTGKFIPTVAGWYECNFNVILDITATIVAIDVKVYLSKNGINTGQLMHHESGYIGNSKKLNIRGSAYLFLDGVAEYSYPTYLLSSSNAINICDGSTITWKKLTNITTE